jgi:hypothetical protein
MTRTLFLAGCIAALTVSCAVGEDPRAEVMVPGAMWLNADTSRAFALTQSANLAVTMRITNHQATTLSLGLNHFVLGTASGLLYHAAPATTLYPTGCNSAASVMSGASIDCVVIFSLNGPAVVTQVGYEFDDKGTSTAQVNVAACSLCGAWCVDLTNDSENCGACGAQVPDGAACKSGKVTCAGGFTRCGNQCVNTQTDINNCGACGKAVVGGTCQSGAPVCSWGAEFCGTGCVDTKSNSQNCGRCGAVCPNGYACYNGACSCPSGTQICGAGCVDVMNDESNCGTCGKTCSSGYYCSSGSCVYGSGGSGGGGGGGGCSMNCGSVGLSCCGSTCC